MGWTFTTWSLRTFFGLTLICFLKCLGEAYGSARTQILLMESLPSISKVFSLVIQLDGPLLENILFTLVIKILQHCLLIDIEIIDVKSLCVNIGFEKKCKLNYTLLIFYKIDVVS